MQSTYPKTKKNTISLFPFKIQIKNVIETVDSKNKVIFVSSTRIFENMIPIQDIR